MAKLVMSDWTNKILVEAPKTAMGIKTFSCTTTTIFPGFPVTATGETDPDVVIVASADDQTTGVALCKPNHDIDTAYAAGEWIPVALRGSGAIVFTYMTANAGDCVVGTSIITNAASGAYCIIGELNNEYVGSIVEFAANDASNDFPVKVRLD